MEHNLRIIVEKLKTPQTNPGLLQGKMGRAIFSFHYARRMGCWREEEHANRLVDEVVENLQEMRDLDYSGGLAGIGTGFEYLVQQGFIKGDTNEILKDFDRIIEIALTSFQGPIETQNGITGYGKYYLSRMRNPKNHKKTNPYTVFIRGQLERIVDYLSAPIGTYGEIYSILDFLPDIIALDIHTEKAGIYLDYAVDLLETKANEDHFFEKYPGTFNPLMVAVLLLRAAEKTGNDDLRMRSHYFLGKYEPGYRQYLSGKQAIRWAFFYKILSKMGYCKEYDELSGQWLKKIEVDSFTLENKNLVTTGMMLCAIMGQSPDEWPDWFPVYY